MERAAASARPLKRAGRTRWTAVLTPVAVWMLALAGPVGATGEGTESAVGAGAEEITLRLLYQLIAILVATRVVTWAVRHLGQTNVSGEILAGLVLGPSVLGAAFPDVMRWLFHPSTSAIFVGLAQVGLVFLMFQIGLEFEFSRHLAGDRRSVVVISLLGIAVPFVLGYVTASWFHARLSEPISLFGFQLFFAVAMSITAIPILGRIFMELSLSHTRTAALTIGAAAIDDVTGWVILGAISLMVKGAFSWAWIVPRIAGLALYLAVVFLIVRKPLKRAIAGEIEQHGGVRLAMVPYVVTLLFVSAAITSNLGVFAIIGGFVVGVALHDDRRFVEEWKRRVSPLVWAFFLPIFFAYTGLRTDVGAIQGWPGLLTLTLVLVVAFVSKLAGTYAAARLVGEERRSALTIGVCMNTRGMMELIVLNIGKDLGLLPTDVFSMLVIMALVSTFAATPLIRWLMKGQELRVPALGEPSAARS
jgi:Kef-type K+ transport system membrane component KefB